MEEKKLTIIEGTINYKLEIDPEGQKHGLSYENKFENDIAGVMIACQVLTVQLQQWKTYKKEKGADTKKAGSNIANIASGLRSIKPLMHSLLDTYDEFKEYQDMMAKAKLEELQASKVEPKEDINPVIPE